MGQKHSNPKPASKPKGGTYAYQHAQTRPRLEEPLPNHIGTTQTLYPNSIQQISSANAGSSVLQSSRRSETSISKEKTAVRASGNTLNLQSLSAKTDSIGPTQISNLNRIQQIGSIKAGSSTIQNNPRSQNSFISEQKTSAGTRAIISKLKSTETCTEKVSHPSLEKLKWNQNNTTIIQANATHHLGNINNSTMDTNNTAGACNLDNAGIYQTHTSNNQHWNKRNNIRKNTNGSQSRTPNYRKHFKDNTNNIQPSASICNPDNAGIYQTHTSNNQHWNRRNTRTNTNVSQTVTDNRRKLLKDNRQTKNVNTDSQDNSQPTKGYMGFKKLEELLAMDPQLIIITLNQNVDKLTNYLKSGMSPDTIVLVLEVLQIIAYSSFSHKCSHIFVNLTTFDFFEQVRAYILQLPLEDSAKKNRGRRFWNNYNEFFNNICVVLNGFFETMPTTALDIVPSLVEAILYTIPNLKTRHHIELDESICVQLEELLLKLGEFKEKMEKKEKSSHKEEIAHKYDEEPPPNDFRDIEIYPESWEIVSRVETYLRPNLIQGKYDSVYHYLDVQYRLLREDFVAPLREGICTFLENIRGGTNERVNNIKVYQNAQCIGTVPSKSQVGYLVQAFAPKSIKNLENSRRFMFGSLVCLTSDYFKSIIFGKIIDRKLEHLKQGRLIIGFEDNTELVPNLKYILIECQIYFEPYFQVLNAMKRMSYMAESRFPMKRYLVDVQTTTEIPKYFNNMSTSVEIRQDLNQSQRDAFKAALTREFCIIQGPPGTGKTFLGLKIAADLLHLKRLWQSAGPMLIICYTNHALDQFLEGLLKCTNKLVRVGGQSKSEALKKFNLRDLRVKGISANYFQEKRRAYGTYLSCQRNIKDIEESIKVVDSFSNLLDIKFVAQSDPLYPSSWFSVATQQELFNWLTYQSENYMPKATTGHNQQQASDDEEEDLADSDIDVPYNNNQHVFDIIEVHENKYTASVPNGSIHTAMKGKITTLLRTLEDLKLSPDFAIEQETLEMQLETLQRQTAYIDSKLNYLRTLEVDADTSAFRHFYNNPHLMDPDDRWLLYFTWLKVYKYAEMQKFHEYSLEFQKCSSDLEETMEMINVQKLRTVDVVGMTTTGAARMHKTLQSLGCPIVIVEEAAEVLESHIITALSSNCQHLILLGDHLQLKPSTADYTITQDYKLGVSLFERMVENGLHCFTLNVQHRMRPEISNLICPSIYPQLLNHESVDEYPPVRGVVSPLYFITHEHQESSSNDSSKENQFEAEYLMALARYLVLNGYDAERITIIVAYSGQWFLARRLKAKYTLLKSVRICILDNFQGEENDIILLSLVRNNKENRNGFLELTNRICVALSRAKHGLYVMGNIKQLCHKNKIWQEINDVLLKYNAVGPSLTVQCNFHKHIFTELRSIEDFQKVPEGGCLEPCDAILDCGHKCVKLCHSQNHDTYTCHQPCTKILCDKGHICPDKCFVECQRCMVPKPVHLNCGHDLDIPCYMSPDEVFCPILISTVLPCGHNAEKPCYQDPLDVKCPHPCEGRIEPCGHACKLNCHVRKDPEHIKYKCSKECARGNMGCTMAEGEKHQCNKRCYETCDPCKIQVQKLRSCKHMFKVSCCDDVEAMNCNKPCKRKLSCGHNCINKCNEECGPCKIMVFKDSICGHKIKTQCSTEPRRRNCTSKECRQLLPCGHECNLPCASPCSEAKCMALVYSNLISPCGHEFKIPCYLKGNNKISETIIRYCDSKCNAKLKCGHSCGGTCGECAQGRIHSPCKENCSKILICGHNCSTPCVEACKPCTADCTFKCEHSKCRKKCGVPCTNCVEPCNRKCEHQKCTRLCGDICNVPPCNVPCPKSLRCGHPCIGFCGDPCPPLCRICDAEEVEEIFFGTEDQADARFIYLDDCGHTVESTGLVAWLETDSNADVEELKVLRCPKCNTLIQAPRFRDQIKKSHKDIQRAKTEYFGHPKELKEITSELNKKLKELEKVAGNICKDILHFYTDCLKPTHKKQRQYNDKTTLSSLRASLSLTEKLITNRYQTAEDRLPQNTLSDDYLLFLFGKLNDKNIIMNDQRVEEFQMELQRFHRIMQLSNVCFKRPSCRESEVFISCYDSIFTFKRFDKTANEIAKQKLTILFENTKCGLAVTDIERAQIVSAVGLSPGHWFKCSNGHIYAIGECGGAMQIAKCPECGLQIGGQNHQLTANNSLATEMDGARRPAFPTINNIDMYQI